jgi:hypothetical protein
MSHHDPCQKDQIAPSVGWVQRNPPPAAPHPQRSNVERVEEFKGDGGAENSFASRAPAKVLRLAVHSDSPGAESRPGCLEQST